VHPNAEALASWHLDCYNRRLNSLGLALSVESVMIRRFVFGLFVVLLMHTTAFSQPSTVALLAPSSAVLPGLQITAALDKASYIFPDTIHLTITGTNTTNAPMILTWASSCQVTYLFDGVPADQTCLAVNTQITIPAQSSHAWTISFDAMPVGEHTIIGMILTYGMAAPLLVTIEGYRLDLVYIAK